MKRWKRFAAAKSKATRFSNCSTSISAALKSDTTRESVKPIVGEIKAELNINTLDRMADYLRLADDPKMPAEQKLSLAISGWLLGSGARDRQSRGEPVAGRSAGTGAAIHADDSRSRANEHPLAVDLARRRDASVHYFPAAKYEAAGAHRTARAAAC